MFANNLGEQKRGNCCNHKGDRNQAERMRQGSAVAALAPRKSGQKLGDALAEIDGKAENRSQLNHNRVHFPVAAVRLTCSSASEIRRCAVELTGKNSVSPSTIPSTTESR